MGTAEYTFLTLGSWHCGHSTMGESSNDWYLVKSYPQFLQR